ncbi:MAG: histone deacetylase [Thermoplasmatota archaeon]
MANGEDKLAVYYHPDYEIPTQTPGHPESPERIREIMRTIKKMEVPVELMDPVDFTEKDLHNVHTTPHIEKVRDFGVGYMDPDTFHTDKVFKQSLKAAGGVLGAGRQAYLEKRPVFALPRPPGHHAGADYNMGFCYFNNVALSANILKETIEDIEKIAILDIDAHHGNGTNDIFAEDPSVLYVSMHNWGIFPGTGHVSDVGSGKGEGYNVNIPMEWGTGDLTLRMATEEIMMPVLRSFAPDMILVSLGADGHYMDPLTGLAFSTTGHLNVLKDIYGYSKERGTGICIELEGGYHLYALAEVVVGAMDLMSAEPKGIKIRYPESKERTPDRSAIARALEVQAGYWNL